MVQETLKSLIAPAIYVCIKIKTAKPLLAIL